MSFLNIKAYAKINISLGIVEKLANGYHNIDSIMSPINLYDDISLSESGNLDNVIIYDNCEPPEGDVVKKTIDLLQQKYHTPGLIVHITKNIPFSSGLGGSSADGAAVARAYKQLFDINIDIETLLKIGSDVPMQYQLIPCRAIGIGEKIYPISLPKLHVAIITSTKGINTAECYAKYDNLTKKTSVDIPMITRYIQTQDIFYPINALYIAAKEFNADIAVNLNVLTSCGFRNNVMTGSGSAVIGLEKNKEYFDICSHNLISMDLKDKIIFTNTF